MPAVRKLGAGVLSVKSAIGLLGRPGFHKVANSLDRLPPFLEHRGEDVPCVNHVGPDLELDLNACRSGGLRTAKVVI